MQLLLLYNHVYVARVLACSHIVVILLKAGYTKLCRWVSLGVCANPVEESEIRVIVKLKM